MRLTYTTGDLRPLCHGNMPGARGGIAHNEPLPEIAVKENLPSYAQVADAVGRFSLCGFLQIAPRRLVERFGPPGPGSADSKVTGTYYFQDEQQRVVQIYDWKATTLYDARPDAGHLSIAAFWASDLPQEFSVATTTRMNLPAFAQWLEATSFREVRV